MARRLLPQGSIAAVETIRKRLDLSMDQFSEALGFGKSSYGEMIREEKLTQTVALAAEALMRRQAPGTEAELAFVVRIVKGAPLVTELTELQPMTLGDQRYLLLPADLPRPAKVLNGTREAVAHASGNGAERPYGQPDYTEAAQV